jgi:hypothetical protein
MKTKKTKRRETMTVRAVIDPKSALQLKNLSTVWPLSVPQLAAEAVRLGIERLTQITVANYGAESIQ